MTALCYTVTIKNNAEEGNTVILGSDAHKPEQLADAKSERSAIALAEALGLKLTDTLSLRPIKKLS